MVINVEGAEEINHWLKSLPEEMCENAKKIIQEVLFMAENEVKDNATNKLKVRTGSLRRSIRSGVEGNTLDTLRGSLYAKSTDGGQTIVYAPLHEYGGVVKAKNAYKGVQGGPYLNIPAPANLTPAGVMRKPAKFVFDSGGYIPRGKRVVMLNGQVMFYLVKSVTIKPRLGMHDAADKYVETMLSKLQNIIND